MSSLLLPLSFALGILGLGMAVVNWLWPAPPKAPAPDPRWLTALKELGRRMDRNTWIMVGIAAAVGFFIALFTGLLVYLVALPGAVILLRLAFGSGGGSAQIEKLAQMEMWTRSLSGLIVAGTSLETALAASMPNAGDLIRDEIATMNARIKAGWPTADALKRLGLEWGDQTGDLVVMQLILAANQRGQGLANALDDLSTSVEEEVSKRRAIYADRAGARLVVPPPRLCTDNGTMVAWAGVERLRLGLTDPLDVVARPRWPLDPAAEPALGSGVKGAKA